MHIPFCCYGALNETLILDTQNESTNSTAIDCFQPSRKASRQYHFHIENYACWFYSMLIEREWTGYLHNFSIRSVCWLDIFSSAAAFIFFSLSVLFQFPYLHLSYYIYSFFYCHYFMSKGSVYHLKLIFLHLRISFWIFDAVFHVCSDVVCTFVRSELKQIYCIYNSNFEWVQENFVDFVAGEKSIFVPINDVIQTLKANTLNARKKKWMALHALKCCHRSSSFFYSCSIRTRYAPNPSFLSSVEHSKTLFILNYLRKCVEISLESPKKFHQNACDQWKVYELYSLSKKSENYLRVFAASHCVFVSPKMLK